MWVRQNNTDYLIPSNQIVAKADYYVSYYLFDDDIEYDEPRYIPLVFPDDWAYMDDAVYQYNPNVYPRVAVKCPDNEIRYLVNEFVRD